MAFAAINEDQKQHLNLSEEAWSVLSQDRAAFDGGNQTGFLNHVLLRYAPVAEASVNCTREKRKTLYLQTLAALPQPQREQAAGLLADADANRIYARVSAYPKGSSVKFRLNNALFDRLTDSAACSEEVWYDGHIGRYLKALLEEYARLPYLQRERIWYAERFETIQLCIDGSRKLRIRVRDGTEYIVRPYRILTDAQSSYHYLVAWSDEAEKAFPYRISAMQRVTPTAQNGKVTAEKRKRIEEALQEKDVPYIAEETEDIRVRMTPAGENKYHTMLLQRPRYTEILDGNIYCFRCTLRQAEYYFAKFGKDARVLAPQTLADRMRLWHRQALENYP